MPAFGRLAATASKLSSILAQNDSRLSSTYVAVARRLTNSLRDDYCSRLAVPDNSGSARILHDFAEIPGFSWVPKDVASEIPSSVSKGVIHPAVRTVLHENAILQEDSSYPLDEGKNVVYVDSAFRQLWPGRSNASGHLIAHGRSRCVIRRRRAEAAIAAGIFLGGNGSYNYYHWLLEIVPKLAVLPNLPEEVYRLPLLVCSSAAVVPSYSQILAAIAPDREIIYLKPGLSHKVGRAVVIDALVTAPYNAIHSLPFDAVEFQTRTLAVEFLRSTLVPEARKVWRGRWPKRIFLARGNQRSYNQDEIIKIALQYGFEIVYPEQYSFFDQVGFFANASVVVGPTGAAWSNLVFAGSQCKALCWMPEELGEFAAFSNIAGIVGCDLRYIFYKGNVKTTSSVYRHSYTLDPRQWESALSVVLDTI